jgi:hypothetical protein
VSDVTGDLGPIVAVRLLELPVDLQSAAQEHMDGLQREFALLVEGRRQAGEDQHELPDRLLEVIQALDNRYASFVARPEAELEAARQAGKTRIDLVYEVPTAAAGAARELGSILDQADDYCREGEHLLTLAAPEPVARYRRWFIEQFVEQIAGAEPVSWPEYARSYAGT